MPTEIYVALIGAIASIVAAMIARNRESSRGRRTATTPKAASGRPALAFFTALALGLSVTALFFAYTATASGKPSDIPPGKTLHNNTRRPYFLTLSCNSTIGPKDMTASVGETEQSVQLIVSVSGDQRMSASAIVPAGSYYRVDVTRVPNLGCKFLQWAL